MLETISIGILVSIIWSAVGYAVAKTKNNENFDALKFAKTLVIGIILASTSQSLGIPITELEGMTTVGFLTALIDKITSLLIRTQPSK